jgi:hypothetical protein
VSARRTFAAFLLVLTSLGTLPSVADARGHAHVEWTRVEVPEGDDAARVGKRLRALLIEASRKADFGDAAHVEASVKVVELTWEARGDVVRMTCAIVGKLKGGPVARAKIRFGGDPSKRDELEKQVLTSVSAGLVSRLAQLARARDD